MHSSSHVWFIYMKDISLWKLPVLLSLSSISTVSGVIIFHVHIRPVLPVSCVVSLWFYLFLAWSIIRILLLWRLNLFVISSFLSLTTDRVIHMLLSLWPIFTSYLLLILHQILYFLVCKLLEIATISIFIITILWQFMILTEAMRYIYFVRVGVQPNLLTKWPREHKGLSGVLSYFLIDFLLEFNELLLHFIIDMSLIL